jgi:hypothetical protein
MLYVWFGGYVDDLSHHERYCTVMRAASNGAINTVAVDKDGNPLTISTDVSSMSYWKVNYYNLAYKLSTKLGYTVSEVPNYQDVNVIQAYPAGPWTSSAVRAEVFQEIYSLTHQSNNQNAVSPEDGAREPTTE